MKSKGCRSPFGKLLPTICVIFAFLTVAAMLPSERVSATAYKGKGTKSDPYLVQTAEQLQGMADNLSAHYKLENTIDLASVGEFKPIGNLAKPFTGSFTCDTDADGTPKYAVKNLKVYNHAGEKYGHKGGTNAGYTDYKEKNSNWEAALFGAVKGATLKNIALLDVNVTNTVVGQNQMNNDWSLNPGQDEQNAAALVGQADSAKIENCSATGVINSKSNHSGGLLGVANGCTIKNSYSKVTVNSTGLWCHGGFVGSGSDSTYEYCFASGDVSVGTARVGGFSGAAGGNFSYCYSSGTVKKGQGFTAAETNATLNNCASASQVTESSAAPVNMTVNNCLVASASSQTGFTPGDTAALISQINAKVKIIGDTSKYVPIAVDMSGTQEVASQTTDTQTDSDNTSEETKVSMTAEEFTAKVAELEEKAFSKKMSLKEALEGVKIKEYYADMSEEERAKVDKSVQSKLETVYSESSKVVLTKLTEKISALPSADKIDGDNAKEVIEVYEMFDGLPDEIKNYFEKPIVDKLKKCYEAAKSMDGVKVVTKEMDSQLSTLQTILVTVLSVINLISLVGLGVLVFFIIRQLKKIKAVTGGDITNELCEEEKSDE